MNERIKELAEQAGIVFWEMSGDVDWRQANKETLEKFAQLIVAAEREACAKVCEANLQLSRDKNFGQDAELAHRYDADQIRNRGRL